MKENKLVEISMDFAIKIIKLCETIKGHYNGIGHKADFFFDTIWLITVEIVGAAIGRP